MPITIEILPDRVSTVRILAESSAEEDQAIQAWTRIRDLIETAHARLHTHSLSNRQEGH